jgi:hypothetical protein
VRHSIYCEQRLTKIRCMRKTLHTVTTEMAPIVHVATRALRLNQVEAQLHKYGLLGRAERIARELAAFTSTPKPQREVVRYAVGRLATNARAKLDGIELGRALVKYAWEAGYLTYINNANHWSSEQRYYGSTRTIYPNVVLNSLEASEAIRELVFCYVKHFGPVSFRDIVWWTGIRVSELRRALLELEKKLVRIEAEGVVEELFMTVNGINEYLAAPRNHNPQGTCEFLAYEDPTLKGYFDTRHRYVDNAHQRLLFNSIGEARPSILLNGRVAGLWRWKRETRCVSVHWFRTLTPYERDLALARRQELEEFLDESFCGPSPLDLL